MNFQIVTSIEQNQMGFYDQCGFFSIWNALCYLNEYGFREDDHLDKDKFLTVYRSWISILQNAGVYKSSDLSYLYIEVLTENDPVISKLVQSHRLIFLPSMHSFGDVLIEPNQVLSINKSFSNHMERISLVLGETGHYYIMIVDNPNSRYLICDSLNSRTIPSSGSDLYKLAEIIQSRSLFSEFYASKILKDFESESKLFCRQNSFQSWCQVPQRLDQFEGKCYSQLRSILDNLQSCKVEKVDVESDTFIWTKGIVNCEYPNVYENQISRLISFMSVK
jgi:hypothetical protein